MAFFEVKNLYKKFGNTEVLKGVSFSVEKGEVLVIIGSSGSGKTTLLRCLNFLERADCGEIILNDEVLFEGKESKSRKDNEIRAKRLHFGLVFQSFNLFPQYNVLQNVCLAPKLLLKEEINQLTKNIKSEIKSLPSAERKEYKKKRLNDIKDYKNQKTNNISKEAIRLIERVGLQEKINNYPCELSGGQCQRVAIARALALNPEILCFDEPTSALDPGLTDEVLKVIKGLKNSDRTMIVVTHEMAFAKEVGDKIIFMADGVVEEEGSPAEVFERPKSEKTKAFLRMPYNE